MKNLRKIIALFTFIFLTGIFITLISIHISLNKKESPIKPTVENHKDTVYLLELEAKKKIG